KNGKTIERIKYEEKNFDDKNLPRIIHLYNELKSTTPLSFYGIKRERLLWKAESASTTLILSCCGRDGLYGLNFTSDDPVPFPTLEELHQNLFNTIELMDKVCKVKYSADY